MFRILLAEDDASMRTYLGRALERAGYEVVSVDRGTAALPLIAAQSFDLLLTDIVMPEMDGIELAQKAAVAAPEMRVMFITGFAAVALKAGKAAPRSSPSPSTFATSSPRSTGCSRPRTSTAACSADQGVGAGGGGGGGA
jgi:two-component system cell cycle response regulator CpdR